MKIALASDHGGYALKEHIKQYLKKRDIEIIDLGTDSEESVDYPDFGKACGEFIASGKADKGIIVCGTGIGISIAANKVKGIRCAVVTNTYMAEMSNGTITQTSLHWAAECLVWRKPKLSSTHGLIRNLRAEDIRGESTN